MKLYDLYHDCALYERTCDAMTCDVMWCGCDVMCWCADGVGDVMMCWCDGALVFYVPWCMMGLGVMCDVFRCDVWCVMWYVISSKDLFKFFFRCGDVLVGCHRNMCFAKQYKSNITHCLMCIITHHITDRCHHQVIKPSSYQTINRPSINHQSTIKSSQAEHLRRAISDFALATLWELSIALLKKLRSDPGLLPFVNQTELDVRHYTNHHSTSSSTHHHHHHSSSSLIISITHWLQQLVESYSHQIQIGNFDKRDVDYFVVKFEGPWPPCYQVTSSYISSHQHHITPYHITLPKHHSTSHKHQITSHYHYTFTQ